MSVSGYSSQILNLQTRLLTCSSKEELQNISQQTDELSRTFSTIEGSQTDRLFELLALSDTVEKMKERFPISKESYVIVHHPLVEPEDYIRGLLTFESQESWNRKMETSGDELMNTPCFFVKLSAIWKKIPKEMRNKIDEEIYLSWHRESKEFTTDLKKGKSLRNEKGFANSLIKKSLEIYCLKNRIENRRFVEIRSSDNQALNTEKILQNLYCPIEGSAVSDLSIFVPCGHNIGASNYSELSNKKICVICRGVVEKVIPNLAARSILEIVEKPSAETRERPLSNS